MNKRIVITTFPLENEMPYLESMYRESNELRGAVIAHFYHLHPEKAIEIFKQHKNILVTEVGCFGTFFEDELEKV